MRLALAYPRPDPGALHTALAARGHGVAATVARLVDLPAACAGADLALVWANLAGSPAELEAALNALPVPAVVVIPPELARAQAQVAAMGLAAVGAAGYDDVDAVLDLVEAAARKLRPARSPLSAPEAEPAPTPPPDPPVLAQEQVIPPPPAPASLPPDGAPPRGARTVLAVWSGSAGGTGKSTLAAEIAGLAAARGMPAALVGLNEPGGIVAALEARPRPDLLDLARGEGVVQKRGALDLVPGPSDPARWGALGEGGPALRDALLDALAGLRATHALLVLDLPPAWGGALVDAALTLADRALYVMRPTAADGAVAARALLALARMQKPAVVAWNLVSGGAGTDDINRALAEIGVAAPAAVGSVPFHPGVGAARDRRQLLFEAAADGVPCVAAASACAGLAAALLGWAPEAEATRLRLPGLRVRVVD